MTDEQLALARQLRALHLPEPVGLWPPAPGWWGLLFCAGALILYLAVRLWRRGRRHRSATGDLAGHLRRAYCQWQLDRDGAAYLQCLPALLRRVAIHIDGRQRVSRLSGQRWIEWLDNASAAPFEHDQLRAWLAGHVYKPETPAIDVPDLHQQLLRWARQLHA